MVMSIISVGNIVTMLNARCNRFADAHVQCVVATRVLRLI